MMKPLSSALLNQSVRALEAKFKAAGKRVAVVDIDELISFFKGHGIKPTAIDQTGNGFDLWHIPGRIEDSRNMSNSRYVLIDYTNWRGERSIRHIRPRAIVFENNEWHPTQWLLEADDLEKGEVRTFALANIHSWRADVLRKAEGRRDAHGC